MRKILVTGAGGFLGRHVLRALAGSDVQVSAWCGTEAEQTHVAGLCQTSVCGEILDRRLLDEQVCSADTVIHLAGPPYVRESFEQPLQYASVHVLGTIAVTEACLRHGVRRLVYVSSAEVYGPVSDEYVSEDTPLAPNSPYGAAKASAEYFIASLAAKGPLSAVILRPFSVFGPGGAAGALIPTIIAQAAAAPRITLANLAPIRDYCYVTDVAAAVRLAIDAPTTGTIRLNIGSGRGTSVREVAQLVLKAVDRDIPIEQAATSDRPSTAHVDRLVASIDRARETLGWQPAVSLGEGLEKICDRLHTMTHKEPR